MKPFERRETKVNPVEPDRSAPDADFREGLETGSESESVLGSEKPKEAVQEESAPVSALPVSLRSVTPSVPAKDAYQQRLERVLEDGLTDIYLSMPKPQRQAFRVEGERVASRLRQAIDSTRIRASEILETITAWLRMIPGINRWFLEQEAKIKTDRVIQLAEERRKEREGI
ncbi:hypothetical protein JW899_04185 [Candidatus Uhrbacteria bacterium]|nr:hypothetical protein [Candidatus Uhrbacteria bacterium]